MKVLYRERVFLDKFRCRDYEKVFFYQKKWNPEGTSVYYFQNGYSIKTIAIEDIISLDCEV